MGIRDGGFKSAHDRRSYLAVYDDVRRLSPQPDAVHDVPTDFGLVRVYQHGPDGGVPLVLIHGFFLTSAMWCEQIVGLADDFTIYTLDMPGQPGASMQSKALFSPRDCARCIDTVLQNLGLRNGHLVAHSYGGWLATHTAATAPGRLSTLTLIDPAHTLVRLSFTFWKNLALLLARPSSTRAQCGAQWVTGGPQLGSAIDELTRLFLAGFAHFGPPRRTAPLVFASDDVLRSVKLPAQVLLAGNTIHNSAEAINRIRSVVPTWRYRLWPVASHSLPAVAPSEVNACIRDFVVTHAAGA